jgi:hypothetical protein
MKGICFKEPLFHKVVAGTKTQTRRIIFPDTDYSFWSQPIFEGMETNPDAVIRVDKNGDIICYKDGQEKLFKLKGTYGLFEGDQFYFDASYVRPRYQPGEILFLKEPYHIARPIHHPKDEEYWYAFDFGPILRSTMYDWSNKLFMPERAARHFIQITDVTAQRLNDITKEDAIAEGFKGIADFQNTWITIHGFSSWPSNPFVWKYTFKPHKK